MARDLCAVPLQLRDDGKTLVIALAEPQNLNVLDQIRAVCGCRVVSSVASKSAIERAVQRFYGEIRPGPPASQESTQEMRTESDFDGTPDNEPSFKILDAQNQTRVKSLAEMGLEAEPKRAAETRSIPAPTKAPVKEPVPATSAPNGHGALTLLTRFEETQKREVATVRALVELLIEKGYFTKEEYLAKMRR
jgi:hypothetical protein